MRGKSDVQGNSNFCSNKTATADGGRDDALGSMMSLDAARRLSFTVRPQRRAAMKIVVIGGSGLIGKKVVTNLRQRGHEVVPASPSSGVNTVTGEGLAQALAGAQVVVDVANAP